MLLGASCVFRWPLVGFMVGSVTGDPTAWRQDPQVVTLCTKLTWLLTLPCILRVVVQGPIWLAGRSGSIDPDTAVAILGVLKVGMGWPLQVAAITGMVWMLGRDRGPGEQRRAAQPPCDSGCQKALQLLLDLGRGDEQELVAGLDRLLGART